MADSMAPPDVLDPMIQRFVEEVTQSFAHYPNLAALSFPEARQVAEAVRKPWREGGPIMAAIEDLWAPAEGHDLRLRLYRPVARRSLSGALVYLHGGGWTLFSLDTHDRVMREYAARSGLIVVGVDYALSPEAKFPAALREVVAVLRWLAEEGPVHGIDPARLAVGGDSAGANLAVTAALSLRDAGEAALLRGLLLNYGVFQKEISASAVRRFGGPRFMLSLEEMTAFWRNYLADPAEAKNPMASPILADVAGLPESFLTIAACDILAEQSEAMARRLQAAGVTTHARVYEGATHSFLEAVSIAPLAAQALAEAGDWLRDLLTV